MTGYHFFDSCRGDNYTAFERPVGIYFLFLKRIAKEVGTQGNIKIFLKKTYLRLIAAVKNHDIQTGPDKFRTE